MSPIALAFAVLEQSGGIHVLGPVLAAQMIPMLLFIFIGGGIADRFKRSTILFWSNLAAGLTQFAMAAALFSGAQVYWLIPLSVLNGVAEAFTGPALRGIVPEVVARPRLALANSLLSTSKNAAKILGPIVAGILVAVSSGGVAIAVDGASFVIAAFLMRSVRSVNEKRLAVGAGGSSLGQDLREGWHYFRTTSWIWTVTISFVLLNFILTAVWLVLGPVIAYETFGSKGWGTVLSAQAFGLFLVSVVLIKYARQRSLKWATVAMSVVGIPFVVLGISPQVIPLVLAAFVAGVAAAYHSIVWDTTLQSRVSNDKLSRVSSYDDLGAYIGIPLAQLTTIPIASAVGYGKFATIGGIIFIVAALAPLLSKSLRSGWTMASQSSDL